jgi:hypothetical protein
VLQTKESTINICNLTVLGSERKSLAESSNIILADEIIKFLNLFIIIFYNLKILKVKY